MATRWSRSEEEESSAGFCRHVDWLSVNCLLRQAAPKLQPQVAEQPPPAACSGSLPPRSLTLLCGEYLMYILPRKLGGAAAALTRGLTACGEQMLRACDQIAEKTFSPPPENGNV